MSRVEDSDAIDAPPWTMARLHDEGVSMRIVNMLGHGSLRGTVDITQLALQVRNADYSRRGFGALVIRFQQPKASVLVYRSGKFLIIGTNSLLATTQALDKFRAILHKLAYASALSRFAVVNIVSSVDLGFKVRLEGLAREHSRFCTYEPELFPGLIYRVVEPKCACLVFVSGKMVITGYKTKEQGEQVVCKLFPVLRAFRIRVETFDDFGLDDGDDLSDLSDLSDGSELSDHESDKHERLALLETTELRC